MPRYLLETSPEYVSISVINDDGTTRVIPEEGVRNLISYLGRVLGIMGGTLIFSRGFEFTKHPLDIESDDIIVETRYDSERYFSGHSHWEPNVDPDQQEHMRLEDE